MGRQPDGQARSRRARQGGHVLGQPDVGSTASATERLWGAQDARTLAPDGSAFQQPAQGLRAEAGYGLPLFGGRVNGTPNLGLAVSDDGARDWRIGWRFDPAVQRRPGLRGQSRRHAARGGERRHAQHGVPAQRRGALVRGDDGRRRLVAAARARHAGPEACS